MRAEIEAVKTLLSLMGGVVGGGVINADESNASQSTQPAHDSTDSQVGVGGLGQRAWLSADLLLKEHGDGGRNIVHMAVAMCAPTSNK